MRLVFSVGILANFAFIPEDLYMYGIAFDIICKILLIAQVFVCIRLKVLHNMYACVAT